MTSFYVSPAGGGDRSGSSWANAATIDKIGILVDRASPADQILLRADQGSYHVTSQIAINAGGTVGKPVVIRGVDGAGHADQAMIVGSRPATYKAGGAAGNELFKLLAGADNLKFQDMLVKNTGTAFRLGADISHLTIDNVDASNVAYFVNDLRSGTATSASVNKLTVRNADIDGFSDKAIYLAYNSQGITIQHVTADMHGQLGEKYPAGVHLAGTVHDVVISDTDMRNVQSKGSSGSYWNGDGFATEGGTYRIHFTNTVASGNTDGGYDLKSDDTVLLHALAQDNGRNFRFWGSADLIDSLGYDPHTRGGTSQQNQVWIDKGAAVRIQGSTFSNSRSDTVVLAGSSGTISFDDVTTYHATSTPLSALYHAHVTGLADIRDHFVYPSSRSHDFT